LEGIEVGLILRLGIKGIVSPTSAVWTVEWEHGSLAVKLSHKKKILLNTNADDDTLPFVSRAWRRLLLLQNPQEEYEKIIVPALSGEPVGNPEMVAAVEDLKHEIVAQTLAIAQLKTDIEDVKGFKGKFGAGDKVQKVAKTDSIALQGKAIVKWFFVANVGLV
jgi:hypothetical protein